VLAFCDGVRVTAPVGADEGPVSRAAFPHTTLGDEGAGLEPCGAGNPEGTWVTGAVVVDPPVEGEGRGDPVPCCVDVPPAEPLTVPKVGEGPDFPSAAFRFKLPATCEVGLGLPGPASGRVVVPGAAAGFIQWPAEPPPVSPGGVGVDAPSPRCELPYAVVVRGVIAMTSTVTTTSSPATNARMG